MKKNGFTLIELSIVIVIIGIVSFVGATLLLEGVRAYLQSQTNATSVVQGNTAIERMSRELRSAKSFSTIGASTITFTDIGGNSITYSLSGSNLMRGAEVLADNVSALSFSYFDSAGNTTASTANVYYVAVSITFTQGGGTFVLRTTIQPRNV